MKQPSKTTQLVKRALAALAASLSARLGATSRRASLLLGVKPVHALSQTFPEFRQGMTWLILRMDVARMSPDVDISQKVARTCRKEVETLLDSMSDEQFEAAAKWLRETVGQVPASKSKADLVAAVRKHLELHFPTPEAEEVAARVAKKLPIPAVSGAARAALGRETGWDMLLKMADSDDDVLRALRNFQQACLHAEPTVIQELAQTLQGVIATKGKGLGFAARARDRMSRAVASVVRDFERQVTGAEGLEVIEKYLRAINRLKPTDPMVDVYARLRSWLGTDDLEAIATYIAKLYPMSAANGTKAAAERLAEQVSGRISNVVGMIAEIIGRKGRYQRIFAEQLVRAHAFTESVAGQGWKVMVSRTPVKALSLDGKTFQQFYDDVILLVDEAGGKVAVVLSAQVKGGDGASLKVLAQLDKDEIRRGLGKLLVDGKVYDIVEGVIPSHSVIVTSVLGVEKEARFVKGKPLPAAPETDPVKIAAAVGDREIEFVPLGALPDDVWALARFILESAGKIPRL